jgi:ribonuclease HII
MGLMGISVVPSFSEEEKLVAQGYHFIAGVDEAGRGALAGPVAAAAVILPLPLKGHWLDQVRDCKLLTAPKREYLFSYIREVAISVGVGTISHQIIDSQGIAKATRMAMKQAIVRLSPAPETLLIDYLLLPEVPLPQKGVVDGDSLCFSIACASIIAKVSRDHLMKEMDAVYPGYGLARHKGYGTQEHLASLARLGLSPIHRRSFQPVKDIMGGKAVVNPLKS